MFDPAVYRIVLFDQRGAGRSTPRIGATTNLSANTTLHLLADMELLRRHLGIERWLLSGTSWGTTLALAYAERFPERVTALILNSVTMTRASEIRWLYHGVGHHFPEEWQRFRSGADSAVASGPGRPGAGDAGDQGDVDLVAAYHGLLHEQPDVGVRERAARAWCDWEDTVSPLADGRPNPRYADAAFRMTFARTVTHYFRHRAWLAEDQLLRDAPRLAGIPGVLVHGERDVGSPPETARELAAAWRSAELRLVDTGHTGGDAMTDAILEATERFATVR
jgi:proline iminopeptidase